MARWFNGTRVSPSHFTILREAERRGIVSHVNEGRRTWAEQLGFVARQGVWSPSNPHGAALPSRNAPHIWSGRENHALDVDAPSPARELAEFYRSLGVPVVFNVPGEPWHMAFPDERALLRAAHSLRARGGLLVTLRPGMRQDDVRALRARLLDAGEHVRIPKTHKRHYGPGLKRVVRRFQRKHGLKADGVVGPKTWHAIERAR